MKHRGLAVLAVSLLVVQGAGVLGEEIKPRATLTGHSGQIASISMTPDGKTFASLALELREDTVVKVWNLAQGKERTSIKLPTGRSLRLALTPDGKTLVVAGGLP